MKKKELMKRILAMMLCVAMLLGTNVSAMADDTVSGGDAGVLQTVCEICEEVECVCQKACETCEEVECICPKACETCGEEACVCGLESVPAPVNTCLICNVDPCTCEAAGDTTETCICGNPDCTCEECEGETCTCASEILSTEDTGVCDICEEGAESCSCTTLTCNLKDAGEKITETITVAGPGLSNKTMTVTPAISVEVLEALKKALPKHAIESYLAYDFVFEDRVTEEGEGDTSTVQETEESKSVKVTITFGEHKTAGLLKVMHLSENGVEEVEASKVNVLYNEDESDITGVEFWADSFSIYAIVWTSDVGATVTGPIVDLKGVEIAGAPDMKIELPADGSEITMDKISKLVVETNTGTEEEPVISTTYYELDNVQWIDSEGTATDTYVYSLKYNPVEERIEFRKSAEDSALSYLDSSYTLRFMYEKATKTTSDHEIVLVDGGKAVNSQTVDVTLYNNEVVNLREGQTNLFDESTKSYVTLNGEKLGNTIEVEGVTYIYKRAVMYDKKTSVYKENDNAKRLYELQLVNETLKQRVSTKNSLHDSSEESKIVFVYCRADVEGLNITAKFANADMTGALAIEDVVIPVTKKTGEVVTAEEDYQTFAEYTDVNREDSKNLIEIDGVTYQFDGAYVTAAGLNYWSYNNATNKKIDALRILGDELQFRTAGTSTWTDMKETSAYTYNLFLVYKEQNVASKTITLTAVLADARNTNLDTVEVTLRKEQLEDGTLAPEAAVSIEELVANGTIKSSYEIDGVEYKFQNAVLVSKLSDFTRQTYYKAVNTKNPSATSINVLVQGLKLNDTQLKYQYAPNKVFDIKDRHIVLVYAEDLHTVETIDSKALGVTIRMVNFKDVQTNFGGPYEENVGRTAGLLTNTTTNGYPSTTKLGAKNFSFEKWFGADAATRSDKDTNVTTVQEANYLFLKKYYDESGTFHYSGFENYASMDQTTGDFTVYEEIGASSAISATSYSHKRGHFLPYNSIAPGQFSSNTNLYDPMGNMLTEDDDRYNENLYVTKETVDYHFGMYLEAEFAQPNNGIYRGEQMVFEFNGDDDFWVYLDGVLVLDIGGIHNAQSGYINFATGEVVVEALPKGTGTKTTIKDMFITALDKTGVNEYDFKGNTFADGSLHKMQVFYMERGKSASNLHLNFNLPTVPSGTIQVEKQLGNTDQEAYTDLPFAFRVMAQSVNYKEEALDANGNHVWIEHYHENIYEPLGAESGAYVGSEGNKLEFSSEGVFTLKPTEVANFPNIQADRKYYVEEVDLAQLQLGNKLIVADDTQYTENGKTGQKDMLTGEITKTVDFGTEKLVDVIKTTERAVSERKKVTFINYITDAVLGHIRIEKEISKGEQNPDYGFNFKVTVQDNITSKMVPYVGEYYLIGSDGNYLYLDDAGELQSSGLPKAYGRTVNGVIPDVKVGQKAEIRDFYQGTRFFVEEVDLKNIYETPKITYDEDTCTVVDADGNKTYHVKGSVSALVIVTNKEKYQYVWTIFKQNKTNSSQLLAGAEFTLTSADGKKTYYGRSMADDKETEVNEAGAVQWYTDSAMTAIAESISDGTYYLAETKAPVGYAVSEEVWTIVFVEEASPVIYKGKIEGEIPPDAELIDNHLKEELDDSSVRHVITEFYYMDELFYELPSTGGPGIYWCMLSGMLLMMAGALMVYDKRRKEVLGG